MNFPRQERERPRHLSLLSSIGVLSSRAQPVVLNPINQVFLPGTLVSALVSLGHQEEKLSQNGKFEGKRKTSGFLKSRGDFVGDIFDGQNLGSGVYCWHPEESGLGCK